MRREKISDENCAMGIGALIVFVAMVLLASIVMVSIIKITEEVSQSTQRTTEDARRNSVNTVVIVGGWVYDNYDDMLFMMEFGSSGEEVARLDVKYVLTCSYADGTFNYRSAALGDSAGGSAIYVWEVGTPGPDTGGFTNVAQFRPGARYFFTLDGGTQATPSGAQCGPVDLANRGINANLYLHLPNGMSTHQELALSNGNVRGSQII
ncbi:MAG: hypothetical protein HOC79_02770 [Euryarchaeota archaeon]|nr:hypothetical protein [Euryarchaeota archaeon]